MKKNLTIFLIMMLVVMTSLVTATSDLNVNGINVPTTMYRDTTYFVNVSVNNIGPDNYAGADNLTFDNGNSIITNHTLPPIANTTTENISIPIGYSALGTYDLEASIPTVTSAPLNDTDMNNNDLIQTITIINQVPTITNPGIINQVVGNELLFDVSAITTELDSADTLTYALTSAPSGMIIDSVTGEISGWTPLVAGSQSFTVQVTDSYDTVSQTINVNSIADQASISFQDSQITFGNSNSQRGNPVTMTTLVKNTGTQVLDNFDIEVLDKQGNVLLSGSQYNPITSISTTSLNPGDTATITTTVTIPDNANAKKELFGSLKVYADGSSTTVNDKINAFMEAESFLNIDDCDIYVNGNHDSCYGTIDAHEGDEIKLKIDIENTYSNDEIKNVYFEAFDNNGWNIDEESSEKNIDGGDNYEFTITFTLDNEIDDDNTQISVEAFGDDNNYNFEHYANLNFDLNIDRANDDIRVNKMTFLTNPIYNNAAYVDLDVEIRNAGRDDQNEAAIKISCPELGLDMIKNNIEINNEDKESRRFSIQLPNEIEAGSYTINVDAYYNNNHLTDSRTTTLEILNYTNPYEEAQNSSNSNSNIEVNTDANSNENSGYVNTPIANPTYGTSSKVVNDNWFVVILIILILAVLGGIAFLASEYLFDNKKAKPIKEEKASAKKTAKGPKKTTTKSATKKAPKKVVKKGSKAKTKAKAKPKGKAKPKAKAKAKAKAKKSYK